ncbi:MAG: DUF485 domain-containing protein [Azospirillaceae bacterium]|nr:DUF485 domain-containing protein [Azospirillaceae bacterium]
MQQEITKKIRSNPKFAELIRKRTAFGWQLTLVILAIYYAFILVIAFAPSILATPIFPGAATTVGIPIGILVILAAFILTGLYVRRANGEFDELNRQIIEETKE